MTVHSEEVIHLWPEGAPTKLNGVGPEVEFRGPVGTAGDAAMLRNVSETTLTVFRPTNGKPNGIGVVVCPGGGWRILAWEHEGLDVARWLTAHGYTAFLLKYRVRGTPPTQAEYDAEMAKLYTTIDVTRRGRVRRARSAMSCRRNRSARRVQPRPTTDAAPSRPSASGRSSGASIPRRSA